MVNKLCGTEWGACKSSLKKLYTLKAKNSPSVEHGMAASFTAAKTYTDKLARIQNQAIMNKTGRIRSISISIMETKTVLVCT